MNSVLQSASAYRFRNPECRATAIASLEKIAECNREGRRFKLASGLGGDPEQSFEQALASLSFSYVKDKAPRLLDYVQGFQLVDRNEDNTKSIGVFGFQLDGGQWIYAPVFFLNGDLKGHELLYLKDQDQFVPLKENWVNYLMARKPHILGQQTPESIRSLGVLQPDIRNLSVPPFYSKSSEWLQPFLPELAKMTTTSPGNMEKFAGLDDRLSVPALCSKALWAAQMMKNACDNYPEINRLCNRFYGPGWLKKACETLKDEATKETGKISGEGSILGDTMDNADAEERTEKMEEVINKDASFVLSGKQRTWNKQAVGDPVQIRVLDDLTMTINDSDFSESERERLYRDGYLVKDYRDGDEVTKEYNVQRKCELVNPDDSGIYDMLAKPAKFEEMLVITNPRTAKGQCDFATVLRTDAKKDWLNAHATTMHVQPQRRSRSHQREWFDKIDGSDGKSLSEGGTYIVVALSNRDSLEGSTPFEVEKKIGDGRYQVRWHDECDQGRPTYLRNTKDKNFGLGLPLTYAQRSGNDPYDQELHGRGDLLFFNDREGVAFKSIQGTLMVPRNCKVIKISAPETKTYGGGDPIAVEPYKSKDPAIEPGNWADIQMQIIQKTAELKIYCDGEHISINAGPLTPKKAGLFELIKDYGFREKTARHMIRESETNRRRGKPFITHVKYAQGYPQLGPGPSAPAIPEPQYGYDATYGGYPTQYQQVDHRGVPELSSGLTDQSVYDGRPEAMPDPMSMQAAQQGGQMNQKEVFDTSMLTGLLKVVRQDSMVDRYTGDLMKALDRLGRMLFLFYWHQDEFMDRYGKADLPELEDSLRNTFEQIGDLLLFLKEKSVAPIMGGVVGEPDIQEGSE